MNSESELGDVVTGFVAQLTGRSHDELPSAEASRDDWLAVLRQWLATGTHTGSGKAAPLREADNTRQSITRLHQYQPRASRARPNVTVDC
jgi:hypothetical protein